MNNKKLSRKKKKMVRIKVSADALMDLEQIAVGGYAPLRGFVGSRDFKSILKKMRLADGRIWSLPITLDVEKELARSLKAGDEIILTDHQDNAAAIIIVEELYHHDKALRCESIYGTQDITHPGVAKVRAMKDTLIGGRLETFYKGACSPLRRLIMTPEQTKAQIQQRGWKTVAAFHTRNVVHRAHEYLQRCALEYTDGLFIHPVAGITKPGDFKKELVIKSYQILIDRYYPKDRVILAALGIGMQFAGPREAVLHALVRKNYGCTHIVIGRDHAGAGGYYEKYAAHQIFSALPDLGITPLLFKGPFYCQKCQSIATENSCGHSQKYRMDVSGTKARELIKKAQLIPHWLMRPEVAALFTAQKNDPFI